MTAEKIIATAKKYLGVSENPPGSNNVIFNTAYYGRPINDPAYAWCVVFVWYVFREAGASALFYDGGKTASCTAVYDWARKAGLLVPVAQAQPGDLVIFDWQHNNDPDHIGICTSVQGSTIYTIEGNVGDAVKACERRPGDVCGVVRPKYSAAPCDGYTDCPIYQAIKKLFEGS